MLCFKIPMCGIPSKHVHKTEFCASRAFHGWESYHNMSVIHNTQRPESMLKKKSNSICYHAVRESVAMGELMTAHIRSEDNPADICTKVISNSVKRGSLIRLILHYLADYK